MRHYNIRENVVHEAINEYNEVSVHHVGGKTNPADLLTKEHKSSEIFRSLRDSFMSRRSSGGCWHSSTDCTRTSQSGQSRDVASPELSVPSAGTSESDQTPGSLTLVSAVNPSY